MPPPAPASATATLCCRCRRHLHKTSPLPLLQTTLVAKTGKGSNPKTHLYVGGLEATVNEAALHSAFIPFGDIKEVGAGRWCRLAVGSIALYAWGLLSPAPVWANGRQEGRAGWRSRAFSEAKPCWCIRLLPCC